MIDPDDRVVDDLFVDLDDVEDSTECDAEA